MGMMKVKATGIRREKHRSDGTGVLRVYVTYELRENAPREAMLLYDIFTGESRFASASDANAHRSAAEALYEMVSAYMILVAYGLEVR